MKNKRAPFLKDESAQDLVEYTLLMCFIVLVISALMISSSGSIQGILFVTTTNLNSANSAAS